jgi:hypothetical protein
VRSTEELRRIGWGLHAAIVGGTESAEGLNT